MSEKKPELSSSNSKDESLVDSGFQGSSEVIEGHIVKDSEATDSTLKTPPPFKKHEKRDDSSSAKEAHSSTANTAPKAPRKASWLMSAVLWILFLAIAFSLLLQFNAGQKLDEFRNDLNQVQTKQTRLMNAQDAFEDKLKGVSGSPSQQELQAMVAELQQNFEQKYADELAKLQASMANNAPAVDVAALQTQQAAFESQIREDLTEVLSTLKTPVTSAEGSVDLTLVMRKIALLEQKLNTIQTQSSAVKVDAEKSDQVTAVKQTAANQVQQWLLEANTQWLLGASAQTTIQKLDAIEKAAVSAKLADITVLARLIGQDIAYLQAWHTQAQKPLPSVERLIAQVAALLPPKLELQTAEKAVPDVVAVSTDAQSLSMGETQQQATAWERLLERMSAMVTIKNRQTTGEPTTVEALLQHDLQKQRLALLIERMQWSYQQESSERYQAAIVQVQDFVNVHFADYAAQFVTLLQPFKTLVREERRSLAAADFQVK